MNVIVVFGVMSAVLFVGAFVTKRRFGLLGLALAAGALLSTIWGEDASYVLDFVGVEGNTPFAQAVTLSAITLLPAVLLLFHGGTHKSVIGRLFGSACFALLAVALLVEPLGHILVLQGLGADVYAWIMQYRDIIIGLGLVLAIFDIFLSKPAHKHDEKRAKH